MNLKTFEFDLFIIGMWWRIVYGSLRVLVGIAFLRLIHIPLVDIADILMRNEIIEDPTDRFRYLVDTFLIRHDYVVTYFLAFHFLFWGVADILLSWSLLRHKLWAFPFSLLMILLFMFYEIIRYTKTHSVILLGLLMVDAFVFWLIYREYKRETKSITID